MTDTELARLDLALAVVRQEVVSASAKHGAYNSAHEAYAVLLEEVDEFWDEVKLRERNVAAMALEIKQVAAVAVRIMLDIAPSLPTAPVWGPREDELLSALQATKAGDDLLTRRKEQGKPDLSCLYCKGYGLPNLEDVNADPIPCHICYKLEVREPPRKESLNKIHENELDREALRNAPAPIDPAFGEWQSNPPIPEPIREKPYAPDPFCSSCHGNGVMSAAGTNCRCSKCY